MYYEDLAPCTYHSGPYDAESWECPLLSIGWLEATHRYTTGVVPDQLGDVLAGMVTASCEIYSAHHFRGLHDCSLCVAGGWRRTSLEVRSHVNVWIPGDGVVYIAPAMIVHYLEGHSYLPPAAFIHAVMECPDYGSAKYRAALTSSNQGLSPPLLTNDELHAKWEQERAEAARRGGLQ